jgi:peptidoglycan/xylan/chitin deacetylase (PgdA/CDA1 family)
VAYIVGNYMGTDGYMDAGQIKELVAAGWEIGSHSRSHRDLRELDPAVQREEIVVAREVLQEQIGVPVNSFAYPFGSINNAAVDYVKFAGYTSAMGLGYTSDQGRGNLYWLQRRDVKGSYDIRQFAAFLPWQGDPAYLPAETPTPTATVTPSP